MPLYDFRCRGCGHEFEGLVLRNVVPPCPACQGEDLERQVSTFAVSSSERRQAAATAKRSKAAVTASRDNMAMERENLKHRHEDH